MFVIVKNKYRALDIQAHEEMFLDKADIYYNSKEDKWAIEVSSKFNHGFPLIDKLEEEWVCQ